ncbi:MAG: ATP synthase F1 subunit gamma [Eubacteriales bacterium]|nr:ATP synthase F1 subunit gamma [Eubacteriales bacterium]
MAAAREIQARIKSIQDTMKITSAMYMISSSKLKKARKNLENTEPYFDGLQNTIARIVRHLPEIEHRFFETEEMTEKTDKKRGYIVITADKGLAGSYNHNVVKLTEECLKKGEKNLLFVVGELGREYFTRHKIPVDINFRYTVQDPGLTRARDISEKVLSMYEEGSLDEVYVIYTQSVNSMKVEARVQRLLPLQKAKFKMAVPVDVYVEDIRMVPSPENVLNNVVPGYVTGFIYGALVESFCSEQNARMMAMEAATENAEKMLRELKITFNRVRQGAITQEITEVIAGARAQKKKKQNRRMAAGRTQGSEPGKYGIGG